ncbi:TetR/AcrR family transcriptional regulator [Cellulomonas triticagri]|uniref:TetR/AcrR family transcriptional regulator n=1 Tax=Cellulomonas triticagri TaxID=2483352 RepID=UPI00131509F4|nr:TetR/AcrR family transcriptional regulator [Cellulomonas triticagri]
MTASATVPARADGRALRAAASRARIAAAATTLFVEEGYAGTPITAVARAAGVGVQTVYYSYPTKADLLVGCLDLAVDGADRRDGGVDLAEQPWVRAVAAEPDPVRRLFLHARGSADLMGRAGAVLDLVRVGAAGEPVLAAAAERDEARRRAVHRVLVEASARDGVLRAALDVGQALDLVTLVLGPETWNALVRRGTWSGLAWARWAHRTLLADLAPSRFDPDA